MPNGKALPADGPGEPQLWWIKLAETASRIGLWLRVRLPRDLGYADGSGALRVAQRLDAAATCNAAFRKELDELREQMRMSICRFC